MIPDDILLYVVCPYLNLGEKIELRHVSKKFYALFSWKEISKIKDNRHTGILTFDQESLLKHHIHLIKTDQRNIRLVIPWVLHGFEHWTDKTFVRNIVKWKPPNDSTYESYIILRRIILFYKCLPSNVYPEIENYSGNSFNACLHILNPFFWTKHPRYSQVPYYYHDPLLFKRMFSHQVDDDICNFLQNVSKKCN